jgi:hypothetical protein
MAELVHIDWNILLSALYNKFSWPRLAVCIIHWGPIRGCCGTVTLLVCFGLALSPTLP